jgi:hypothetical protein
MLAEGVDFVMKPAASCLFTFGDKSTMERKTAVMGTAGTGSTDASGAIRRPNDVWVLPAARIKQILRGTFLENPPPTSLRT